MNFYLLPALEFGPTIVERIIRQIPPGRWDESLVHDRFTPREVAAHLADWEPILRHRIRAAADNPGSTIQGFDEVQMAREGRYSERYPLEQCADFARERAVTAALIRTLTSEQWAGVAHHTERGPQSAEDLANLLLGHDLYHIEQLSEFLAARSPR